MPKFSTPPMWYDKNGNLNETLTGSVGTDLEVTITNSMAIGKDSIVAGNCSVAIGTNAGSYGKDAVAIGYNSQTPSSGSIAIGSNTVAAHNNPNGKGSIAIGNNSQVVGDGSIVIGSGIMLGDEEGPINDTIQIGSVGKTYSAQIGDGNGVLKCKASEVVLTSYRINQSFSAGNLSISYPNGFILKEKGIYAFIFTVNGGYQTIPIIFNGTKSDTTTTYFNLSYGVTESKETIIYGSVVWGNSSIILHLHPIATSDATAIVVRLGYIVYLGSF